MIKVGGNKDPEVVLQLLDVDQAIKKAEVMRAFQIKYAPCVDIVSEKHLQDKLNNKFVCSFCKNIARNPVRCFNCGIH